MLKHAFEVHGVCDMSQMAALSSFVETKAHVSNNQFLLSIFCCGVMFALLGQHGGNASLSVRVLQYLYGLRACASMEISGT